jgi:hypothetical protein
MARLARKWLASWLELAVIANKLKSWLGSAHYDNELSRARHEPSELTSFEFSVQPDL